VRDEKGKRAELPQIMSDQDMLAVCIRLIIREKLKKNEKVKIHRPSTQYGHSSFLFINAVLNLNLICCCPLRICISCNYNKKCYNTQHSCPVRVDDNHYDFFVHFKHHGSIQCDEKLDFRVHFGSDKHRKSKIFSVLFCIIN
jgi:hypothetical protein